MCYTVFMSEQDFLYMITIGEQQNLSKAARALYISQPSLSQALSRIEKELGQPLFLRTKSGMVPTEFGRDYLKTAEKIQMRYKMMLAQLEEFRTMNRGTVTFGIPYNMGASLLPVILPGFHQRYPRIQIHFIEASSGELDQMLLSGKLDFSISHQEAPHPELVRDILAEDAFYLIMSPETAARLGLTQDRPLKIQDLKVLKDETFLMLTNSQKPRLVTDSILETIGISPVSSMTMRNIETTKRLAAAGMGVTFLPYSYLSLFSGSASLSSFALDQELQAHWKLSVSFCLNSLIPRCSREFIRYCGELSWLSAPHTAPGSPWLPPDTPLPQG